MENLTIAQLVWYMDLLTAQVQIPNGCTLYNQKQTEP